MDWKCTKRDCPRIRCEYNPNRWHEKDARRSDMEGDPRFCLNASTLNFDRPFNGKARKPRERA